MIRVSRLNCRKMSPLDSNDGFCEDCRDELGEWEWAAVTYQTYEQLELFNPPEFTEPETPVVILRDPRLVNGGEFFFHSFARGAKGPVLTLHISEAKKFFSLAEAIDTINKIDYLGGDVSDWIIKECPRSLV